ncbi:putative SWEET sugar transporter [Helianthus annuus]|nr:putative SWEET sugar transporter [Helianthus annuus]KAJ0664876.1 putative SWEET sugar transporter [Helianthus annuus]KAJ0672306.1 putative SWEET sugar transporter [Helianthus annuus]
MVHPHSLLLVTVNAAGFLIETIYLLLFLIYSNRKQRIKVQLIMLAELVFLTILSLLALTVAHTTKVRSDIVGPIAIVGNIMMYAAPLSVMKLVITTKSVEFMPFFLSLFSLLNGVSWTVYALIRFDPYIVYDIILLYTVQPYDTSVTRKSARQKAFAKIVSIFSVVITYQKSSKFVMLFFKLFMNCNDFFFNFNFQAKKFVIRLWQIPNGLGSLLGAAQLILYATFYQSTKRQLAERKATNEMGLDEMGQSVGPAKGP